MTAFSFRRIYKHFLYFQNMVLIIDAQIAGISGDMFLCALVDLGADKNKILEGVKKSQHLLPDSSIKKIDFNQIQKHGISCTELILDVDEKVHHRTGIEMKKAVLSASEITCLSDNAKKFAENSITTLISAESKIHGIPEDSIHFHEASSIDTLVDILGIAIALDDLDLFDEKIVCMPVSVGSGTVSFSHGEMSNPASAILEIFRNSDLVIQGKSVKEELTTPTGASVLVNLCDDSVEFYPPIQVNSIGYGGGQKNFEGFSNVLKIILAKENHLNVDSVQILETNIDDVSGEILGNLIEKIMKKNAKDVSIFSGITKKNRPTNLLSVICETQNVNEIADVIIHETGTLGIRIRDSSRILVPRTIHDASVDIEGTNFKIRFKKFNFGQKSDFKIEFDDLKYVSDRIDKSIKETDLLIRKEIEKMK